MKYPIECIEYIVRSTISAFENIGDLNHTPISYVSIFGDSKVYISIFLINRNTCDIYGCIRIYHEISKDNAVIYELHVSPKYRNKGNGTLLIKIAEKVISRLHFKECKIEVKEEQWIVDWYKSLGYKEETFQTDSGVQLYKRNNDIKIE